MTPEEAIGILKNNYPKTCRMVNGRYQGGFDNTECDFGQALTVAISTLKEVQQYREIGTVEECQEAGERQKPKKVIDRDLDFGYYTCPSCGTTISFMEDGYKSHKFCLNCGQAILQEDEDD